MNTKPAVIRFLVPEYADGPTMAESFVARWVPQGHDPAHVTRPMSGWSGLTQNPHYVLPEIEVATEDAIEAEKARRDRIYKPFAHGVELEIEPSKHYAGGIPASITLVNTGARCFVTHYRQRIGADDSGVVGETHILHSNSVAEFKLLFPENMGLSVKLERY